MGDDDDDEEDDDGSAFALTLLEVTTFDFLRCLGPIFLIKSFKLILRKQ